MGVNDSFKLVSCRRNLIRRRRTERRFVIEQLEGRSLLAAVYVDPDSIAVPDTASTTPTYVWIDLDNSGGHSTLNDRILKNDGSIPLSGFDVKLAILGEDTIRLDSSPTSAVFSTGGTGNVDRINSGASIEAFGSGSNYSISTAFIENLNIGAWNNTSGTAYVGFSLLPLDSNPAFSRTGWLRLTFDDATNALAVLDWAYESDPDVGIIAGAGLSSTKLTGTLSIGPMGDFSSARSAITGIQTLGIDGPVILELQSNYFGGSLSGGSETLVFSNLGTSAVNTVTLRPALGAVGKSFASNSATVAVDLNGAQYLTIDGRPGGLGTTSQLAIANNSSFGPAVRFINEASNNTIKYTRISASYQSASQVSTGGVVHFRGTTGPEGNDNNTIDQCEISGASPNSIYSFGTSTTIAQNNHNNTISNSRIFGFGSSTTTPTYGIRIESGNSDWTIKGNSIYQPAVQSGDSFVLPIFINSPGNNFRILDNYIGGRSPNAGGDPWTGSGGNSYRFAGISLRVGNTSPSSVQGNVIRNIAFTSANTSNSLGGVWSGIYVSQGAVNIGNETGNTIGSGTGTGSIRVRLGQDGGTTYGISTTSAGPVVIANNTIGSIETSNLQTVYSASLVGIHASAGNNTIANNTIGSTSTANSLNALAESTSASTSIVIQQVTGIRSSSNGVTTVSGNTIANLKNAFTRSGDRQVQGISTTNGQNTITGNLIDKLTSAGFYSGQSSVVASVIVGINQTSSMPGQIVSENVVRSLVNSSTTAHGQVIGIYYTGGDSDSNRIEQNFVHSLLFVNPSVSQSLHGIYLGFGRFSVQNNMVQLGVSGAGGQPSIYGIADNGSGTIRNFYHNSVFIGGTQYSGSALSYALYSLGSNGESFIKNNIFVNARNKSGGTGGNYAIGYESASNRFADGNIIYASGTGGILGYFNGNDVSWLNHWQALTGQDAGSAFVDPNFVNPTGSSTNVDLHLHPNNPAEGNGIPIVSVSDDYDGDLRNASSPVDIGADAGAFTSSGDFFAPQISYSLIPPATTTSNPTLNNFATIVDNSGAVSGGLNSPRLYFKRQTDTFSFGGNTAIDNGWKFVTASNASSPYSFTIDYSILFGGAASFGDVIEYFVVAQDDANNLGSNPIGARSQIMPPVQNVNRYFNSTNKFPIYAPISGSKTVGLGGDYPSLTGPGGLFAAINTSIVLGDLDVQIISDLNEDGSNALNQWLEMGAGGYSLTLRPSNGIAKTISGNVAGPLISLNGADRVTIDGRFGGAGRFLTFRNLNPLSNATTIYITNDASHNVLRNSIVEGVKQQSTAFGVVSFGASIATGNDFNTITENQVRDLSNSVGVPLSLVTTSVSNSGALSSSSNTISNNDLFNFGVTAISIGGGENWTIANNNIYNTTTQNARMIGISIHAGGSNLVAGNYIHDLFTSSDQIYGIEASGSTTISGNRVLMNGTATNVAGIRVIGSMGSNITIANNQVTLSPTVSSASSSRGIEDSGAPGSVVNEFYNTVVIDGTATSFGTSHASLYGGSSTHTSKNNLFFNHRTGGTGNHFAAGVISPIGSYVADYNLYVGSSVNAGSLMDFPSPGGPVSPVSFSTWQAMTGGDAHSQGGNPGGNFSIAMFVDVANGDLHLVPGGNPLVTGTGIPIPGITTDVDGQLRSLTAPDIGADELVTHSTVWNRGLFYNRSTSSVFGDGSGNPVNAIDSTKAALLPGQGASFANYTNYVHGLNGLIVDVANLAGTPTAADFQFDTWNGIDGAGFVPLSTPATVSAIVGGGVSGSTRLKIEFPNGAIKNTWLRVTMLANATTDLASNDVFYFGNAIGDMNAGNVGTPTTVRVNATDTSIVRQNQSIASNSVGVSSIHDVNKDGRVNATDTSIVRQNQNAGVIRFFDPPASLLLAESSLNIDSVMADSSWLEVWKPTSVKRRVDRLLK